MDHIESLGFGIWRLTLPLPFTAPNSVNTYIFEGADGLTMVDCGVDTEDGYDHIVRGLDHIGATTLDIHRLIGSHLHVDHMALAKRLVEETGAEWVMHETTPGEVRWYNNWEERGRRLTDIVASNGAPADAVERYKRGFPQPDWYSTAIDPTHPVSDGDRIPLTPDRHLDILFTPGHQPNHITLFDERSGLLFSGDHVLPGISPFVPYDGGEVDHLGDYLSSIERVELLNPGVVLPGHGPTIERGRARARQISLHHERRLGAITQELKWGPKTAWEVMGAVFRPNLSHLEQRLAIQETLAHLEYLSRRGTVERIHEEGTFWFRGRNR
jgi:glyoxylase-like metal-dependent hydrolase (beta-lactamase superfamily II)